MNKITYDFKISKTKANKLVNDGALWRLLFAQVRWNGEEKRTILYKVTSEVPKELGVFRKF